MHNKTQILHLFDGAIVFFFYLFHPQTVCLATQKSESIHQKKQQQQQKGLQDSVHKTRSPLSSLIQLIQRAMRS